MTYSKWKFSTTPTKNRREIVKNNKKEKQKRIWSKCHATAVKTTAVMEKCDK